MPRKEGRPTKYRREFHPEDFINQSKRGKTFAQIAAGWELSRDTILEWQSKHPEFSGAVKKGRQFAEAWYMNLGQAAMLNQAKMDGKTIKVELGWFCWMTKNMFKWSDKISVEEEKRKRPLEELSDQELDQL